MSYILAIPGYNRPIPNWRFKTDCQKALHREAAN